MDMTSDPQVLDLLQKGARKKGGKKKKKEPGTGVKIRVKYKFRSELQ